MPLSAPTSPGRTVGSRQRRQGSQWRKRRSHQWRGQRGPTQRHQQHLGAQRKASSGAQPQRHRESEPGGREREVGGAASEELGRGLVTCERITSSSVKRKRREGFWTLAPLAFRAVSVGAGAVLRTVGPLATALVSGRRMSACPPSMVARMSPDAAQCPQGNKTAPADSLWQGVKC